MVGKPDSLGFARKPPPLLTSNHARDTARKLMRYIKQYNIQLQEHGGLPIQYCLVFRAR